MHAHIYRDGSFSLATAQGRLAYSRSSVTAFVHGTERADEPRYTCFATQAPRCACWLPAGGSTWSCTAFPSRSLAVTPTTRPPLPMSARTVLTARHPLLCGPQASSLAPGGLGLSAPESCASFRSCRRNRSALRWPRCSSARRRRKPNRATPRVACRAVIPPLHLPSCVLAEFPASRAAAALRVSARRLPLRALRHPNRTPA